MKTATEVASDNSELLRNIRRHENRLERAIVDIGLAVMEVSRGPGESIPDEGEVRVMLDDSIVTDTAAENEQDMLEVGVTMQPWEYRCKWYGEDEPTAGRVPGSWGPEQRQLGRGSKKMAPVVESKHSEADLGGTKLGPRMGVGIFGLLRIPLLLGSAFLLSSGLTFPSTCAC